MANGQITWITNIVSERIIFVNSSPIEFTTFRLLLYIDYKHLTILEYPINRENANVSSYLTLMEKIFESYEFR